MILKRNRLLEQSSGCGFGCSFFIVMHYFGGYLVLYPLVALIIAMLVTGQPFVVPISYHLVISVWMIITTLFLGKKILLESWRASKGQLANHLFYGLKLYIPLLITAFIVSQTIAFFTDVPPSQNQLLIEQLFIDFPFFVIITATIMAPIVEEIVFRGVLYRALRNKNVFWLAVIISTFSFGFIHIYESLMFQDFGNTVHIFVYAAMGFFFVKAYEDTGSIFPAIFLHFINNAVSLLVLSLI